MHHLGSQNGVIFMETTGSAALRFVVVGPGQGWEPCATSFPALFIAVLNSAPIVGLSRRWWTRQIFWLDRHQPGSPRSGRP